MSERKVLDTSKSLVMLAAECWTADDLFAAFRAKLGGEQQNIEQNTPQKPQEEPLKATLIQRITDIFRDIGIPASILGYGYLRYGIELAVKEPNILNAITKELYPVVAKKYGTTGVRVERAIRHAIDAAWDRGDLETLQEYFGYTVSKEMGRLTNSEFIATIADKLRLEGYEA